MQPLMRKEEFVEYQFNKLIAEQQRTNQLLQQLLDTLKPPVKEVEPIATVRHDKFNQRKR